MTSERKAEDLSLWRRGIRKARTELARRTTGRPGHWPAGRRVVSFTFDDFPASAATTGADILESFGVRGTFYAAFGLAGRDSESGIISTHETIAALGRRGHEIGCHTFGHLDCSLTSPEEIARDCARNREAAREHGVATLSSFAYPFGAINSRARGAVAAEYETARSAWTGINRGRFDAAALRVVPLMSRNGSALAINHLTDFLAHDGWLLFYTHDVAEQASTWGCQPSLLIQMLEMTRAAGVEILPVRDVKP